MNKNYLFTSAKLGFRDWQEADVPLMATINADPEVMEFFPGLVTSEETAASIGRMKNMLAEKGFCYFAVDELERGEFIGFIGLVWQTFESEFTPCVDIGWRLAKKYWGKGYATEGAKRCLEYAFKDLGLTNIKATAPKANLKSIRIMEKIGMKKQLEFIHPRLLGNKKLENCVCYEIG